MDGLNAVVQCDISVITWKQLAYVHCTAGMRLLLVMDGDNVVVIESEASDIESIW